MTANYDYVIRKCNLICDGERILDYGCGAGEVVIRVREIGLNISGVDAFYAGSNARKTVNENGLFGKAVFELSELGGIPFENGYFDLAVSNQVFEHAQNLDLVLTEIHRILKPGGQLLAPLPSRGSN
jgi:ubiquinone/menaquinone biosynthesis C-methylase UbiE